MFQAVSSVSVKPQPLSIGGLRFLKNYKKREGAQDVLVKIGGVNPYRGGGCL